MVTRVTLTVRTPAMMPPPGPGAPVPDPTPMYMAMIDDNQATTLASNGVCPPSLGPATVAGGHKVGDKIMGCTYFSGPYVIPGLGEVEFQKIGP